MLGGIGGKGRRGHQRMRCLGGITDSMDVSLSELRADDEVYSLGDNSGPEVVPLGLNGVLDSHHGLIPAPKRSV